MEVSLVATGLANVASVRAAFARLGAGIQVVDEPQAVLRSPAVVLPGVGSIGPAMEGLRRLGMVEPLRERLQAGRPTLAICLGMQLLCGSSEEASGPAGRGLAAPGLGDAEVRRLPEAPRLPHFGWNRIAPDPECALLRDGLMYFAHSFALTSAPPGWRVAWSDHGSRFIAAMERGDLLACQFHPELSGGAGSGLLRRWLDRAAARQQEVVGC